MPANAVTSTIEHNDHVAKTVVDRTGRRPALRHAYTMAAKKRRAFTRSVGRRRRRVGATDTSDKPSTSYACEAHVPKADRNCSAIDIRIAERRDRKSTRLNS